MASVLVSLLVIGLILYVIYLILCMIVPAPAQKIVIAILGLIWIMYAIDALGLLGPARVPLFH